MTYEAWDTETFNRVGTFSTQTEAEAYLGEVLRENGPEVATEMAIVGYPETSAAPVMILEGAIYVAQHSEPA